MTNLHLSPNLKLPLDAVTQTFAILAKRGVGKTHTASVMAEEMLKVGQPIVVYDPTGAWWGLKSSKDGKQPGFPVVIFGGEHADVPLEETAGSTVASVIVEKRIPAILDCSLLRKGARIRLMTDFCETLYHKNRQAIHFFVDEAQTIAPQNIRAAPEMARLLGAMEDIVLQGRRRGLGMTVISPRPALVNTNIRSACEVMIAMQINLQHDRKAISEWIDAQGDDEERGKQMMAGIQKLKRGEAWVWSPSWLEVFKQVTFRERETFDSSATPKVGERVVAPKQLASIDLDALGAEIKATVEKAKADDPKELRKQIAELKVQLAKQPKAAADPVAIERAVVQAIAAERKQNAADLADRDRIIRDLSGRMGKGESLASQLAGLLHVNGEASLKPAKVEQKTVATQRIVPLVNSARENRPSPVVHSRPAKPQSVPAGDSNLGKCERAILQVLSQYPDGCDSGKLTLLSGYRFSGGFRNSLSSLRSAGLIDGGNGDVMTITADGEAMGPFDPLPEGDALIRYWLNHSSISACGKKILQALLDFPDGLAAGELCNATGYEFSGGFRNALSELRTAGLIVGKNTGTMELSQHLLEAAGA